MFSEALIKYLPVTVCFQHWYHVHCFGLVAVQIAAESDHLKGQLFKNTTSVCHVE